MKKFLPLFFLLFFLFISTSFSYAKTASGSSSLSTDFQKTKIPQPIKQVLVGEVEPTPIPGTWVSDSDVTFVGKAGARSGEFLDWTLSTENYKWSTVIRGNNPIQEVWKTISFIAGAFFVLFVLISAFVMIATRGKNLTIKKFIPRFMGIVILVAFSFAITQFLAQIGDVIQGFFLKVPCPPSTTPCPTGFISQKNLLNISFDYSTFEGFRRYGAEYDESAFISLLLIKITSITYYVMSGILIIRKIILWFFIIVSPIFPFLFFYKPIRNTGKIWVGEFFRWLLYAPLFSVFLNGLVTIWQRGIPLNFTSPTAAINCSATPTPPDFCTYPTSVNILLGGPGQVLSLSNSVNYADTFALYVVALLMLWVVIILPFLLLQIFLDYLNNYSFAESTLFNRIIASSSGLLGKSGSTFSNGPSPLPSSPSSSGLAMSLPFSKNISIPEVDVSRISAQLANLRSIQEETIKLANLSVPTMRDIAKFETAITSSTSTAARTDINQYKESLTKIANPESASSFEREKYIKIKDKLVKESRSGNNFATSVLAAAKNVSIKTSNKKEDTNKLATVISNLSNPEQLASINSARLNSLKSEILKAESAGDPVAKEVVSAINKGKQGVDDSLTERLKQAKETGNKIAALVMGEAGIVTEKEETVKKEETARLSNTISNLANPELAVNVDTVRLNSLKTEILNAESAGDPVAKELVTAMGKGKHGVDEELTERIKEAKATGNKIASLVLEEAGIVTVKEEMAKSEEIAKLTKIITNLVSPEKAIGEDKEKLNTLKTEILKAESAGDPVAKEVVSVMNKGKQGVDNKFRENIKKAKETGNRIAALVMDEAGLVDIKDELPAVNRIQSVSIEDYEAVRKLWKENYETLEPPKEISRKEWIKHDIDKINTTINYLVSQDQQNVRKGMDAVGSILPFLLIGGFSKTEVIAYLKAKWEAAKAVLSNLDNKDEDEVTMIDSRQKKEERLKEMEAERPEEVKK